MMRSGAKGVTPDLRPSGMVAVPAVPKTALSSCVYGTESSPFSAAKLVNVGQVGEKYV